MLNQRYRVYFNNTFLVADDKVERDKLLDKVIALKVRYRIQPFTE